jgi:hypothetical protein
MKCGAHGEIGCDCGVEYIRAGKFAAKVVADPANAGKSDRAIAAEIGVGHQTVMRARQSTGPNGPVGKRIGRDGKARKLPSKPKPTTADIIDIGGHLASKQDQPIISAETRKAAYAADEITGAQGDDDRGGDHDDNRGDGRRRELLIHELDRLSPDALWCVIAGLRLEHRNMLRRRLNHKPHNIELSASRVPGDPAENQDARASGRPGESNDH